MSDIAPISRPSVTGLATTGRASPNAATAAPPARGDDKVELSRAAQFLSKLAELPDVRQGLIDRVKAEIASGNYETPEKIDAAIDNLREDLA